MQQHQQKENFWLQDASKRMKTFFCALLGKAMRRSIKSGSLQQKLKKKRKIQKQRSFVFFCAKEKRRNKFAKSFEVAKMQSDSLQKVSYRPKGSSECQSVEEIVLAAVAWKAVKE